MTEPSDEFISALLRDSSALDLDVGSAYEGVTRRVQHVKRRRAALLSGTACIALFAAVVFAGSRIDAPDDVQPGGPATDQRGDLIPDSGATTTSTTEPISAAVTSTESMETVVVAASAPAGSAHTQPGGSSGTSPSTASSDDSTPGTSDDGEQSGDDGPDTTDDDHSGSDSSGSGSGAGGDDGRSDGDGESGGG